MQDECTCNGCSASADDLLIPQLTNHAEFTPITVRERTLASRECLCEPDKRCLVGTCSLPPPRLIIGLSGLAGSGKSTAAAHLVHNHGFARVRFAGPLKDMMRALGLSEREVDGDLKEAPCTLLGGKTPRYAMQTIGTEWGRDLIAPDLWIRAWQAAVDALPAGQPVVADDCRFPNEADAIRAAGGFLVRMERPGAGAGAAGHSSEGQDLGTPFVTVKNTGSIPLLGKLVDGLVWDVTVGA